MATMKKAAKSASKMMMMKKGGSFPDLNKDGKIAKSMKSGGKMTKKCAYGCK